MDDSVTQTLAREQEERCQDKAGRSRKTASNCINKTEKQLFGQLWQVCSSSPACGDPPMTGVQGQCGGTFEVV